MPDAAPVTTAIWCSSRAMRFFLEIFLEIFFGVFFEP
jgi:hypothetical protein